MLAPLALMPGLGEFLFRPMALAVAFAMISAYLLSRSFVPRVRLVARGLTTGMSMRHGQTSSTSNHEDEASTWRATRRIGAAFARWEALIDVGHPLVRAAAGLGHAVSRPDRG